MFVATISRIRCNAAAMTAASIAFALLMGFSALIRIPVPGTPVPITLQTFTLFLGAGLLRQHYALMMVAWYLLLGLCGAPFFTGGGGWHYLFGATGGYLVGFAFAAALIGYIRSGLTYPFGVLAIYIPGVVQLKVLTGVDWVDALSMGALPFILFDAIKAAAAYGATKVLARSPNP